MLEFRQALLSGGRRRENRDIVRGMASQATNDHIEDALKVTKAKKAAEDEEQKKKAEAEEIAKKIDVASKAAGDEVIAAEGKSFNVATEKEETKTAVTAVSL